MEKEEAIAVAMEERICSSLLLLRFVFSISGNREDHRRGPGAWLLAKKARVELEKKRKEIEGNLLREEDGMLMSRLVTGMIQGDIGEKEEINIAVMLIFCSSWYYIFCCCRAIQDVGHPPFITNSLKASLIVEEIGISVHFDLSGGVLVVPNADQSFPFKNRLDKIGCSHIILKISFFKFDVYPSELTYYFQNNFGKHN
ncbi:hypothetical protein Lal_00002133 [Lupinus albus]|nr:hypothetical protein Lal_00002133 [Lupinus albus]